MSCVRSSCCFRVLLFSVAYVTLRSFVFLFRFTYDLWHNAVSGVRDVLDCECCANTVARITTGTTGRAELAGGASHGNPAHLQGEVCGRSAGSCRCVAPWFSLFLFVVVSVFVCVRGGGGAGLNCTAISGSFPFPSLLSLIMHQEQGYDPAKFAK